ncbi:peptide/nickel transport system permease protein [Jatrophihabitans sp. GAS493]|uniref:ABC transporter permease n=1 Tax=Jatrophihabitans sp. GAS493 TaxID=1907575 RepID=UPI000BB8C4E9|nr:ABC transporter permease [Jatrophihabitans sp. GAS493]SOD72601.1 peptide/nickel transport system permease protein [Jatrophihabitans sp. GAS493]
MNQVLGYLARRLVTSVITLLVLTLIIFTMVKVIPGDEAHVAAGVSATPEQVAAMRTHLGLDRSLPVQYFEFLDRLIHGDLGTSISSHSSIAAGIWEVLPQTIELVLMAMLIMILVAVPAAVFSALRSDRGSDTAVRAAVIMSAGLPTFWLALVAQYVLSTKLGWFPISGALAPHVRIPRVTGFTLIDTLLNSNPNAFIDGLHHLLLPAIVLALPFTGQLYRTLRTDMIGVLDSEYIDAARAKGVPAAALVRRHLLPNSAGAALTVIGATFSMMVGAAVLVESVFGLNGIGAYLTNAVANSDRLAVVGAVLVIGVLVVASSFAIDVIQLIRDPRIRAGQLASVT